MPEHKANNADINYRTITAQDDAALAAIIRDNLKARGLDIPGTVYFDSNLDHLSSFYLSDPGRTYIILTDSDGSVVGGVGLAAFTPFENCAELQKLYLADRVKGRGLGYEMIARIEQEAGIRGYSRMYLETHDNLDVAIHLYQRCGYTEIDKPEGVVHSSMNRFFIKVL